MKIAAMMSQAKVAAEGLMAKVKGMGGATAVWERPPARVAVRQQTVRW